MEMQMELKLVKAMAQKVETKLMDTEKGLAITASANVAISK